MTCAGLRLLWGTAQMPPQSASFLAFVLREGPVIFDRSQSIRCCGNERRSTMTKERCMGNLNFKYGTLIRGGPKTLNGGKWDATLKEYVRNAHTNADLSIQIRVYFAKISPALGRTGLHGDHDDTPTKPSKKKIQMWAPGEFESFTSRLVRQAQRYWDGVFWLQTPQRYTELNWPDERPTHRCHLYCRFELNQVQAEPDS